LDQAGPLSFEAGGGHLAPRPTLRVPGYGRDPVGKGQAAAGFSAVLAPGLTALDGIAAGAVAAWLALGLAAFIAFFFFPAFFFFLADFFLPAAFLAFFSFFFFRDAFFFFFFFPPFFAFFFAMLNLLQGC